MIQPPEFFFNISGKNEEILPGSVLWNHSLSGRIFDSAVPIQKSSAPGGLTIGEYFSAAKRFLSKDNAHVIRSAQPDGEPIQKVVVSLIKHGAFYHPMKVEVLSKDGRTSSFVLNGAVSEPGLALLKKEHGLLARLGQKSPGNFIPRVFGMGIFLENGREFGFFLGQWFNGFREFHVTGPRGGRRIVVWDDFGNSSYLSFAQAASVYEQISFILTSFYGLETFEQVFPWHHAAGDFVVDPEIPGLPVKMISVRGYSPLVEFPSDPQGRYILPSLLFFFLNLSLRIRIDRLDGIGETVFMNESVLTACVRGFLRGLRQKNISSQFPLSGEIQSQGDLVQDFAGFFRGFSPETLQNIIEKMTEDWHPGASELGLIGRHAESHCAAIHGIFKNKWIQDFY